MNIRFLMLGAAVLAVAGVSAGVMAADEDSVMIKPSYTMSSGAPPALESPDEPKSESELSRAQKEEEERQARAMAEHNMKMYGTEDGPFAKLEGQAAQAEAARKKVATYSMTYEERQAMIKAEEAAAKGIKPASPALAEKMEKPAGGYIYNRKKTTDTPPRLFNNVTP